MILACVHTCKFAENQDFQPRRRNCSKHTSHTRAFSRLVENQLAHMIGTVRKRPSRKVKGTSPVGMDIVNQKRFRSEFL